MFYSLELPQEVIDFLENHHDFICDYGAQGRLCQHIVQLKYLPPTVSLTGFHQFDI
jgi:hypothetical protein